MLDVPVRLILTPTQSDPWMVRVKSRTGFCWPRYDCHPKIRDSTSMIIISLVCLEEFMKSVLIYNVESKVRNPVMRQVLQSEDLTMDRIDASSSRMWRAGHGRTWAGRKFGRTTLSRTWHWMRTLKVLTKRLHGQSNSVNCFCPSFTKTSMYDSQEGIPNSRWCCRG